MKVILYIATSINGYITNGLDDSNWVSKVDWNEFDALKRKCRVMVMGRKTYLQFGDGFPQDGALNVVATHNPELLKIKQKGALFTDESPTGIVKLCEANGFEELMLIGGMELNTSFLKENLVDEIWLSIHPLIIGNGLPVMGKLDYFKDISFLGYKQLDQGLMQLRYKIK